MSSSDGDSYQTKSPAPEEGERQASGTDLNDRCLSEDNPEHVLPTDHCSLGMSSAGQNISSIDRLLEVHRREINYELCRVQLTDRPVTGQGNREVVENFFVKNLEGQTSTTDCSHRPENVTVEVRALIERRPVSSLLQSVQFRRNLESSLRGALSSVTSTARRNTASDNSATDNIPSPPRNPPTNLLNSDLSQRQQNASTPQIRSVTSPPPSPTSPNPRAASRAQPTAHPEHAESFVLQPADPDDDPESNQQATDRHQSAALSRTTSRTERQTTGQRRDQRDGVFGMNPEQRLARTAPLQEALDEMQRDEMIAEISRLIQQQLVTSSLEGAFRGRLERLLNSRLTDDQADGRHVLEVIRGLPPRRFERNDFSNLGIGSTPLSDDEFDHVSVISATAAVSGSAIQNASGLYRQMAALKAQLNQIHDVIRMSFDMQIDIQRAIRQEVASAIRQAGEENSAPSTGSSGCRVSTPHTAGNCVICLDKPVDAVLYQCGHVCVCYICGLNLKSGTATCPMCRAPIRDVIRTYRCSLE